VIIKNNKHYILLFTTYIVGIIAFVLFCLGLSNAVIEKESGTDEQSIHTAVVGLFELKGTYTETSIAFETTLNTLGASAVIFFLIFLALYISHTVISCRATKKFDYSTCALLISIIVALVIGVLSKPYDPDNSDTVGKISRYLNLPDDHLDIGKYNANYTSVGVGMVSLVSVLGATTLGTIIFSLIKKIKKTSK
jgi:hypothetical protein